MRAAYAIAAANAVTENTNASAGPVTLTQAGKFEYVTDKIGTADLTDVDGWTTAYVNVDKATGQATISQTAASGYTVYDPVSGEEA